MHLWVGRWSKIKMPVVWPGFAIWSETQQQQAL
jgi:hypothetical protein